MMHRLILVEEGINNSRKRIESHIRNNSEAENSLGEVIRQLEKIQKEQKIPPYRGNRDDLEREIMEFQKILEQDDLSQEVQSKTLENYANNLVQPFNKFEAKMAQHNKAN